MSGGAATSSLCAGSGTDWINIVVALVGALRPRGRRPGQQKLPGVCERSILGDSLFDKADKNRRNWAGKWASEAGEGCQSSFGGTTARRGACTMATGGCSRATGTVERLSAACRLCAPLEHPIPSHRIASHPAASETAHAARGSAAGHAEHSSGRLCCAAQRAAGAPGAEMLLVGKSIHWAAGHVDLDHDGNPPPASDPLAHFSALAPLPHLYDEPRCSVA
jgi:hypothetical protein